MAFIDGIRGFAALWVMVFHAWCNGFRLRGIGEGWAGLLVSTGHLGVPIFLTLSGFCLAYPYVSRDISRIDVKPFAIRRVVRILPPYWICVLSVALLTTTYEHLMLARGHAVSSHLGVADLAESMCLIQNFQFEHFATVFYMDSALWSIPMECQIYLIFPILMLLTKRLDILIGACALISSLMWGYCLFHGVGKDNPLFHTLWLSSISFLLFFGAGMFAAAVKFRHIKSSLVSAASLVTLLMAMTVSYVLDSKFPAFSMLLVSIATAGFLVAGQDSPSGRFFATKSLSRIGLVSYTLYMIHGPIQVITNILFLGRYPDFFVNTLQIIVSILAVPLAIALFPIMELPFHRMAKSLAAKL